MVNVPSMAIDSFSLSLSWTDITVLQFKESAVIAKTMLELSLGISLNAEEPFWLGGPARGGTGDALISTIACCLRKWSCTHDSPLLA